MSRLDEIERRWGDKSDDVEWLCAKLRDAISIIESVNGAELVSFPDGEDMSAFLKSIGEDDCFVAPETGRYQIGPEGIKKIE